MYEEYFGLTEKPFSIQPDPSFLYWGRGHRLAYAMLEYGVLNHAGISVITGEVGCGKTTLIHRLLDQLSDTHTVSLLSNIQTGRGDLLSWVLMGFDQPFAGKTHVEMFAQLQSFFISEYARGRRVVLIIDEAQNLSVDMLEELRLLSNINSGKDQLLQLILVGQPELKDLLNRPEMLQLAQRVGSDFHLTPLSAQEVQAYLDTRLSIAGCRRHLFTDLAVEMVAEHSRGVPRVINIIADTALVYAFSAGDTVVGAETIKSVVRDKLDYGVFGLASDEIEVEPIKPDEGDGPDAFVARPAFDDKTYHGGDDEFTEGLADDETDPRKNDGAEKDGADLNEYEAPEEAHLEGPVVGGARGVAPESVSMTARYTQDGAPALEDEDADVLPPVVAAAADTDSDAMSLTALAKGRAQENTTSLVVDDEEAPQVTAQKEADEAAAIRRAEPEVERAANTGVVIVGGTRGASPEAVIRGCGDGRAIVFVPYGDDTEVVAQARAAGAVIADVGDRPFNSIGRARNAGYRQLKQIAPHMRYVQFLDYGSVLDTDWLATSEAFLDRRPEVSAVEGMVRDRNSGLPSFPKIAEIKKRDARGEIVTGDGALLVRAASFESVGGFRGDLLTADTKDLCVRLRRRGGHIWRLPDTMVINDDYKQSIGRWWSERNKAGFESAYCSSLYGGPPERLGVLETARATLWGFLIPGAIVAAAGVSAVGARYLSPAAPMAQVFGAVIAAGVLFYLVRMIASAFARGVFKPSSWRNGFFAVMSSFPEFLGVVRHTFTGESGGGQRN